MQKLKRYVCAGVAIGATVISSRWIARAAFFTNSAGTIFSRNHLLFEIVVGLCGLFLILDGWWSVRRSGQRGITCNGERYLRIIIGLCIILVHGTVLLMGGYR